MLGGVYTLLGVKITLNHQTKSDDEKKRLENLPILKFDIHSESISHYYSNIFTLDGNEIYTSGFPMDGEKLFPIITITLANDKPAFDVYLESCITTEHRKEVIKNRAYSPAKYRLVPGEKLLYMFWIKDYKKYRTCNVQGLLRVSYSDIFENKYYQDVPFVYDEMVYEKNKMMEIDGAKVPVLADDALPLLELIQQEYPICSKVNTSS